MSDPLLLLGLFVVLLSLAGIFLCSLSEAALLGMSEVRLRRLAESSDPRAPHVTRVLANSDYLSALIVGLNAFVILISTVMTLLVRHRLAHGAPWAEEAIHIGMVLVILVFAELTPKTYGGLFPERVSLAVARPVSILSRFLRPLVVILARISEPLLHLTARGPKHAHFMSLEEIRAAADVGEEEGLVDAEEAQMLDSVIDLGETEVREIMVPRVDMAAAEETMTVPAFAAMASQSGFSRIPIYHETMDNITGIVYVTDVLRRLGSGETDFSLKEIARPPLYFPETKRIDDLFRELREQRVHIAIAVDEFGGTAGLVAIEDILEELVGEIEDEHDVATEEIVRLSEKEAVVDGKVRIEEANELLGTRLPEEQYETIGGLVCGLAGHIPAAGETYKSGGVKLVVEESDGQYVQRVRLVVGIREDGDG